MQNENIWKIKKCEKCVFLCNHEEQITEFKL